MLAQLAVGREQLGLLQFEQPFRRQTRAAFFGQGMVVSENLFAERIDLDGKVTIRLAAGAIIGSGQNLSEQGVFFVAEGSVPVEVEIEVDEVAVQLEVLAVQQRAQ